MMEVNSQQLLEFSDISKNCIIQKLHLQYLNSEYVDVTLQINSRKISVHSFLLAAESDYFKEKLKVASGHHIYIDLSHVCSNFSYLESIINYLYKRQICLGNYNIKGILKICHYCSFKRLLLHTKQFLLTRIRPTSCLKIWRIARKFHFWEIEKMALILMQELFWEERMMTMLKFTADKELSYLLDHAPFPRKVTNAYRFLISWVEEDFSKRLANAHKYFSKFIPKMYLEHVIKEMNQTIEGESETKSFLKQLYSDKEISEKMTPFFDTSWVVVLKEREYLAIYFSAENRWMKILATLTSKVIGILGNDIVILDECEHKIKMLNMISWCACFISTPYTVERLLVSQYFCLNTGIHIACCTAFGKGIRLQIKIYEKVWKLSASIVFRDWKGDCKMKIEADPEIFDTIYIFLTSRECDNDLLNADKFVILRYDSLNKRFRIIFESKSWAASINCMILFRNKDIHIIEEILGKPFIVQCKSGSLTATSILDRNNTITVNIPICTYRPLRPDNVTLSKNILYFAAHFESIHYCSYSSKLFLLEHVAPFITRVFVYDILDGNKWVELSPSPLSNVHEVTIDVFSRNSVLKGGFHANNEKQPISTKYYPFINLHIDKWNGVMELESSDLLKEKLLISGSN
ncbi:uncharacterized protein LOC128248905 [Octopus bimaculoides]|uniref:uncharacterized protein LOC128248905 n=1 Tax=Octopus bimaculoides TaxID=37653 RepID=UPI0022E52959|nr:uncharacterized protein LOC128248905 [Octopus bimaculoides]XP_052827154.1 uncharacterized protein LOC128248905 [Octopus bimaculoides]